MFEKAVVEEVILSSRSATKQQQFANWNSTKYSTTVAEINSQLNSIPEFKNLSDNDKKIVLDRTLERFFNKIPDNTLIVSHINKNKIPDKNITLCYPFFSSHIMMPIKPGEVVWVFNYESETRERNQKIYRNKFGPNFEKKYWLSRVHGESFNEDLNYTHHDRGFISEILKDFNQELVKPNFIDSNFSYNIDDIK